MPKSKQNYDEKFRKNAVKPSYTTSRAVKDLAASLEVHPSLIHRW